MYGVAVSELVIVRELLLSYESVTQTYAGYARGGAPFKTYKKVLSVYAESLSA
jgi:peptide methionine sulfoxide reductase MsrA